ncbi:hypothetical protein J6Q66_03845 [bacterium]|nr:hypothetical protein [bacterium]
MSISIRPKIFSSIKNSGLNSKISLPQEINLTTKKVSKKNVKHSSCGGLDTLCNMYNMF